MKSYSFSAFKDYDNCMRQFFLVRAAKMVSRKYDGSGPGRAFHKVIDQAIKHGESTLPSVFTEHNWVLRRVMKIRDKMESEVISGITSVTSEVGMSVTTQWEAGPMFSKDAWYCAQIDFLITRGHLAYLTDWKFGNSGYADVDQLYQQACMVFHGMPEITRIRADLTFVRDKVMVPAIPLTINRDTVGGLRDDISRRAQRIYNTSVNASSMLERGEISELYEGWEPTRSGLCGQYCPVTDKHCPHGKTED